MVSNIRDAMVTGTDQGIRWLSSGMKKRFSAWMENPYAFNSLTTEDITSVAFMARMGGVEAPQCISSGMGLYGSRLITENLGGTVLYTTTYENENPLFMYILPVDPHKRAQPSSRQLRRQIIRGTHAA